MSYTLFEVTISNLNFAGHLYSIDWEMACVTWLERERSEVDRGAWQAGQSSSAVRFQPKWSSVPRNKSDLPYVALLLGPGHL
jgi:hypothetical protein